MNDRADALAGFVSEAGDRDTLGHVDNLTGEFEVRLADSSALAFRVAYSILRQRQDAEDVAQEAFARAFQRFSDLRDREKFRAWLVRMTWRIALDWKRRERRRAAREDVVSRSAGAAPAIEADVIAQEQSARLWAAIDALPEKLRIVTVLAAIDGHAVKDVAALVGAPEGTVKSRLFDARKLLQERLR